MKFVTHPDRVYSIENIFEGGVFINPHESLKESENVKLINGEAHTDFIGLYKGPYKNLPHVHRLIRMYASKNNLEVTNLPIEVYLNNPFKEKSENLLTEIRVPVINFDFDKNVKLESLTTKIVRNPEYVMIRHYGSMEEITAVRNKMDIWNKKHNIPVHDSYFIRFCKHALGIFKENMFFDVGYLTKENNVNNQVKIVEFPHHQMLSTIYKGPYEKIKEILAILREYGVKKGLHLFIIHRENILIITQLQKKKNC